MDMLRETGCDYGAGDYIVDGTDLLAFRKEADNARSDAWNVFTAPLRGFSKTRRSFTKLKEKLPKGITLPKPPGIEVQGSNGKVYYVNEGSCTCPGFTFRGKCKHV